MLNMRILGPGVGFLYLVVVPEDVVFKDFVASDQLRESATARRL